MTLFPLCTNMRRKYNVSICKTLHTCEVTNLSQEIEFRNSLISFAVLIRLVLTLQGIMSQVYHFINDIIKAGLASLKIMPSSYPLLFPPEIKPERIQQMVEQGVFPTVEGLAPAITYAILLSLARFLLHIFVFKV